MLAESVISCFFYTAFLPQQSSLCEVFLWVYLSLFKETIKAAVVVMFSFLRRKVLSLFLGFKLLAKRLTARKRSYMDRLDLFQHENHIQKGLIAGSWAEQRPSVCGALAATP